MQLHSAVYVNGYGATHDLNDANYARYLGELLRYLHIRDPKKGCTIYLCGGFTNRTDLSEARCMLNIIQHLGMPTNAKFILIEDSTTTRTNLVQVYQHTGKVPLTAFCEFSREPTVRYLAKIFFPVVTTAPIAFDHKSLTVSQLLKQRYLKLPLEIAACHSPAFDAVRIVLRERHVARCRAQET